MVWFDEAQHAGIYHQNWRLENDPSALAAFSAAAAKYWAVSSVAADAAGGPAPRYIGNMGKMELGEGPSRKDSDAGGSHA